MSIDYSYVRTLGDERDLELLRKALILVPADVCENVISVAHKAYDEQSTGENQDDFSFVDDVVKDVVVPVLADYGIEALTIDYEQKDNTFILVVSQG